VRERRVSFLSRGNLQEQKLMVDCRKTGLRFKRCGARLQAQAAIVPQGSSKTVQGIVLRVRGNRTLARVWGEKALRRLSGRRSAFV